MIGVIKLFAGNFAPRGFMLCQGQILSISQNTALFAILGTTYGGNGVSTFALPDLRSRVPMGEGQGPGLSDYALGEMSGSENTTILTSNMPPHTHMEAGIKVSSANATESVATQGSAIASPGYYEGRTFTPSLGFVNATPDVQLSTGMNQTGITGSGIPINNLQPFTTLNYIICVEGIFPPRQ
ncbi:tail fiber protein [Flavobacterium sp. NRK1]|uniref:phage tail protein n=1 Tax=Flavobacterium sp. NRK1 TaxID=2954929 RepID=UPI0027E365AD|nr:tail fiber protein [Flavobacterium sp. NRK1]